MDLDVGSSSDLVAVTGTLTLAGATVNIADSGGFGVNTYTIMTYGTLVGWGPGR